MPSKVECIIALRELRTLERAEVFRKTKQFAPQVYCDDIDQLIVEHFTNEPVFLNEVKVGDWLWDNDGKKWVKIKAINKKYGSVKLDRQFTWKHFAVGRYFRKEVKE